MVRNCCFAICKGIYSSVAVLLDNRSIATQERIKFAGCKPRIRFARQGAMIARINCKY
jgi:hypothetical protein